MTIIQQLIEAQDEPQAGVHFLKLEKAYLRCAQCRAYVLARTNEQAFEAFVGETCHSGPLPPATWNGHRSHVMIRCGAAAECSRCLARGRIVEDVVFISKRLKDPCPASSQDLRRMFSS